MRKLCIDVFNEDDESIMEELKKMGIVMFHLIPWRIGGLAMLLVLNLD